MVGRACVYWSNCVGMTASHMEREGRRMIVILRGRVAEVGRYRMGLRLCNLGLRIVWKLFRSLGDGFENSGCKEGVLPSYRFVGWEMWCALDMNCLLMESTVRLRWGK